MRRWLPAVMTVAGLAAFGWLGVARVLSMPWREQRLLAGLFLAGYLFWMAWESRISVREISSADLEIDRWTLEMAIAIKLVLVAAIVAGPLPALHRGVALALAGTSCMLLACGATLRLTAIRALGRGYSHRIRSPVLPLVQHGPYAWIRHPAYLGACLIHAGMACLVPNVYALVALAAWFGVNAVRTRVEDRWLQQLDPYRRYSEAVRGVWLPRPRRT